MLSATLLSKEEYDSDKLDTIAAAIGKAVAPKPKRVFAQHYHLVDNMIVTLITNRFSSSAE